MDEVRTVDVLVLFQAISLLYQLHYKGFLAVHVPFCSH